MGGGGSFGGRRGVLEIDEVEVRIFGFGGAGGEFGSDDGDRGVTAWAVFFAADEGGTGGFALGITGR